MGDKAEHLRMIADDYNVPVDVAKGAMERAAADYARAMTARAQPAPRPKWPHDAKPDKTPAHFASRAGYVHRGEISSEDRALHKKLFNWLRTHDWPGDVPYIPTLPEWNERQAVKLPELRAKIGDEVRQVKRLEAVARRVAHTAPRIPAM